MSDKNDKQIMRLIDRINTKLDNIEDMSAWLVSADQRFKKGQRVQFNDRADRRCISEHTKGGVRRGTVLGMDGFIIKVQLDGYKNPKSYHHSFFERVTRSK